MPPIRALLAAAAVALPTSACQTPVADLVRAANDLDPACYKNVDVRITPVLIFGYPVPLVSGGYQKTCNPDQAAAVQRVTVVPAPAGSPTP